MGVVVRPDVTRKCVLCSWAWDGWTDLRGCNRSGGCVPGCVGRGSRTAVLGKAARRNLVEAAQALAERGVEQRVHFGQHVVFVFMGEAAGKSC